MTLYLVATPIGNLEDITLRALRVLTEVDLIACEDTRQTLKLMRHFKIEKPTMSFHAHNEKPAARRVLAELAAGRKVALVSDGGTPGISDPGALLVNLARGQGVKVVPVPGPSALSTLLSVCGSPGGEILFAGFLSPKAGRRRRSLERLLAWEGGVVLYESCHRILKLLEDLAALAPRRRVLIGREMTKIHEEFLEEFPAELLTELAGRTRILGEIVVFIAPEKRLKLIPGHDDTEE